MLILFSLLTITVPGYQISIAHCLFFIFSCFAKMMLNIFEGIKYRGCNITCFSFFFSQFFFYLFIFALMLCATQCTTMETVHGICKLLTLFGNLFENISDALGTANCMTCQVYLQVLRYFFLGISHFPPTSRLTWLKTNEPRCEKTGLRGFRPGPT